MKLVANFYGKKYGYPPILVDVGAIQLDILPFTLGFFEAILLGEIESEKQFDVYLETCAQMAEGLIYKMGGVILTEEEIDQIETEIFCSIVQRSCNGELAIA